MTLKLTILGCGTSGGVPRVGNIWGACDSSNPKNRRRRCSVLVQKEGGEGTTNVLVDSSPDLRQQLLDVCVGWLDGVLYTHAHADHARAGGQSYLCVRDGKPLLQSRLGHEATIETLEYGEIQTVGSVKLSLHPAGHILGSAQVKIVENGFTCVVSGDYKTDVDPTCPPLEPLRCDAFISECTFGLPIFRWPSPELVIQEIHVKSI